MEQRDILTFHSIPQFIFFPSVCGYFSRIDHILEHKKIHKRFKKIVIIPCIFSKHSVMKLANSSRRKTGKFTNIWKLNNTLLVCCLVRSKKNLQHASKQMKIKHNIPKHKGCRIISTKKADHC